MRSSAWLKLLTGRRKVWSALKDALHAPDAIRRRQHAGLCDIRYREAGESPARGNLRLLTRDNPPVHPDGF
jgi:hypothetical protein